MHFVAFASFLLLTVAPLVSQRHAINLELLQLAFGRSSLDYQQVNGLHTSVGIRAQAYLGFTDIPRIITEQFTENLSQQQHFDLDVTYDLHFGLGFELAYWPEQPLRAAFTAVNLHILYQTYDFAKDGLRYQGDAILVGTALRGGYRWLLDWFNITLTGEVGVSVPFAVGTVLNHAIPYAAVGASVGAQW